MNRKVKASDLSSERRAELRNRFRIEDGRTMRPASADPAVEQLERAFFEPDHWEPISAGERDGSLPSALKHCGIRLTPPARRPQRVQDEITRLNHEVGDARTMPTTRTATWNLDLDYLHSNLPDRPSLPMRSTEDDWSWTKYRYSTIELMAEMLQRGAVVSREALLDRMFWYLNVALPAAMDSQGRTVIPHGLVPGWRESRSGEGLPDGCAFVETEIAVPIPYGYTALRIARMLAIGSVDCWWCGSGYSQQDWDEPEVEYLPVMLVGTGGGLHMFPTCDKCKAEFGPGPDYYRYSPEDDDLRGNPAEQHR